MSKPKQDSKVTPPYSLLSKRLKFAHTWIIDLFQDKKQKSIFGGVSGIPDGRDFRIRKYEPFPADKVLNY